MRLRRAWPGLALAFLFWNAFGGVVYDRIVLAVIDDSRPIDDGPLASLFGIVFGALLIPTAVLVGYLGHRLLDLSKRSPGRAVSMAAAYVVLSLALHLWLIARLILDAESYVTYF